MSMMMRLSAMSVQMMTASSTSLPARKLMSYSLATLSHRPMLSTTVYIHGDADWLSGNLALK